MKNTKNLSYYKEILNQAKKELEKATEKFENAKLNYDQALMKEVYKIAKIKNIEVEELLNQVNLNHN